MLLLLLLSTSPVFAAEPAERIASLLDADRRDAATWWARSNLAKHEEQPEAWTLLGLCLEPEAEAEAMFRAAIALDPSAAEAWAGLARLASVRGEPTLVVDGLWQQVLMVDPSHPEAWEARVWLVGVDRPQVVNGALNTLPDHPQVLRAAAAVLPKRRTELLNRAVMVDPRYEMAWTDLARQALVDGRFDQAELALNHVSDQGSGATRSWPLRRLLECGRSGAADRFVVRSMAEQGVLAERTWTDRAPNCSAAWAQQAAYHSQRGAISAALDARSVAIELSPDPDLIATQGLALAGVGDCAGANPLLDRAWQTHSGDHQIARARVACAEGPRRFSVVRQVWSRSPHLPKVVLAYARVLDRRVPPDDVLQVLLRGLELSPGHRALTQMALEYAEQVRQMDAVLAPLAHGASPALPSIPGAPAVDETIVVLGQDVVDRARRAVVERLALLGYRSQTSRDGTIRLRPTRPIMPRATLHPDGRFEVQEAGMVKMPDGTRRSISRRKLRPRRELVLAAAWPAVGQWQATIGSIGRSEWLDATLPDQLQALWERGVPLDFGPGITDRAARRAILLDYWSSRTCTPEGEAVRQRVALFIEQEVQNTPWAATPEQLLEASKNNECGATLP